jgi:intracellular sulfur oxidation DsrE/DsrF family protein
MIDRRSFLSTAAAGVAAMAAMTPIASTSNAEAQLVYTTTDWSPADFNRVMHDPARIKQAYDVVGIGGGKFLNNIKNSLNGLHFGFGIPVNQIKVVAGLHGPANMLNFTDEIWSKYQIGAWLKVTDPKTGQPATKNIFYPSKAGAALKYASNDPDSEDSIYQDTSVQALQHRGVTFLSCHTATEEQVRALIQHNNLKQQPEDIVRDMLAHMIPGAMVVASMVAALALLQTEGHYSYLKV